MPMTEEVRRQLSGEDKTGPGEFRSPGARTRRDEIMPKAGRHVYHAADGGFGVRPKMGVSVHAQVANLRRGLADVLGVAEGLISKRFLTRALALLAEGRLNLKPSAAEKLMGGHERLCPAIMGKVPVSSVARNRRMMEALAFMEAIVRWEDNAIRISKMNRLSGKPVDEAAIRDDTPVEEPVVQQADAEPAIDQKLAAVDALGRPMCPIHHVRVRKKDLSCSRCRFEQARRETLEEAGDE